MTWEAFVELLGKPLFTVGKTDVSIALLIQFVVVVALVLLVARLVRHLLRTRILSHTKLDVGLQYAIARITGYVVLVLGFIVGLSTLGIDLTSLTVLAGALGVGIGFGLQTVVNNFVSGLILLAERTVQIGDRVEIGETAGRIMRIGARSTSVLTNDNIVMIIPNAEFVSGRVINWTQAGDQRVRIRVPVAVSYGSDPLAVRKILLEVADANNDTLKDPAPAAVFRGFGESSLDFELRVWTATMTHRPGVYSSDLYFAIWERFKQLGISIPFPQRDLHIKEPLQVEVKQS
jgi:small-conductance mechanosensitive channel